MWKMLLVMFATAFAILAGDFAYKQTLPETRLGAADGALIFARSSIPPNCTLNPWTGKMTCHDIPKKKPKAAA